MTALQIGSKVKVKQKFWTSDNPIPQGTITKKFQLRPLLDGNAPITERQFECALRDADVCEYGYFVVWDHNNCENPWSEIELELA